VIALLDDQLVCSCDDLLEATLKLLEAAQAGEGEVITLYYGGGVLSQEASSIADQVRIVYPKQETELVHGGQPHYDLILSVE